MKEKRKPLKIMAWGTNIECSKKKNKKKAIENQEGIQHAIFQSPDAKEFKIPSLQSMIGEGCSMEYGLLSRPWFSMAFFLLGHSSSPPSRERFCVNKFIRRIAISFSSYYRTIIFISLI